MTDDYGSNVHAGPEKSVRFMDVRFIRFRVSALEMFFHKGFLKVAELLFA